MIASIEKTERAMELEHELAKWTIEFDCSVFDVGAWQGVWSTQNATFAGDKIEEAREFVRSHGCDRYTVYDPNNMVGEHITAMFWQMVHEWDQIKKEV